VNTNIRRIGIVFTIIFILISVDLVYWQVIDANALNNYSGNPPPANPRELASADRVLRGKIFDRNGVLLVGRRVWKDGLVQPYYTDPSLAQTVGYHSRVYGDSGLESVFNSYLSGSEGTSWSQTWNSWLHRPVQGDNIYLTIDERIQKATAEALSNETSNIGLGPDAPAAAVVFNPQNGDVLASVSQPYFNATCLDGTRAAMATCWHNITSAPGSALINRVIQGLYPPGSTFKTVTLSAALDSGKASLSDEYAGKRATGPLTVQGYTFGTSEDNLQEWNVTSVDLLHAYMYSDNIVFARLGLKIGPQTFLDYAHRFLVPIPYDLPVCNSDVWAGKGGPTCQGVAPNPGSAFDKLTLASSAFGQGKDHVTPLQMALVAGTIAHDGEIPRPRLIKAIKTPGGQPVYADGEGTLGQPISSTTAHKVRHAMVEVVAAGSGFAAAIPGVAVAGKTGTAQVSNQNPDAWFICFAPAKHPRIAAAVVIEQGGEGAYVAGPVAQDILLAGLRYTH
jgi:peptidoglycan glycosyltransferase